MPAVFSKTLKTSIAGILLAVQVLSPTAAVAAQYLQLIPIKDLAVLNGTRLPSTNVDPSDTSSSSSAAGGAVLRANPAVINFGTVLGGTISPLRTLTVANLGGRSAVFGSVSTSAQYVATNNCDGITLPPLGTCQLNVNFAPVGPASGLYNGNLILPFTANGSSAEFSIPLTATAQPTSTSPAGRLVGFGGADPQLTVNGLGVATMAFDTVLTPGGEARRKTFVLQSNGTEPLAFSGLDVTGNDGSFTTSSTCPATIPVGQTCAISVDFLPLSPGAKSATLQVLTNSSTGATIPVNLLGQGIAPAGYSLSANALNFPGTPVTQVASQAVTLVNYGGFALNTPSVLTSGAGFSASHTCPPTLASGGSCTVTVQFTPSAVVGYTGQLSVSYDSLPVQTLSLSGQGTGPVLTVDVASQDFGNIHLGDAPSRGFLLRNEGNVDAPLTLGTLPAETSVGGNCGGLLAPGASCNLVVTVAPSTLGPISGTVTVASTLNTVLMGYAGVVVPPLPAPAMTLSTTSLAFGDLNAAESVTQNLLITNSGNVALENPAINLTGTAFASSHNCPLSLPSLASCTAVITFAPISGTDYSGQVTVGFDAIPSQTAFLTGTGRLANLTVDQATRVFDDTSRGMSGTLTYALTNTGNTAAALSYSTLTAPVTKSAASTCDTVLLPGQTCTVVLAFTPVTTDPVAGSLVISSTGTSATLNYSGVVSVVPNFTLSSGTLDFGTKAAPDFRTMAITVSNTGAADLTAPVLEVTGTAYNASHNCPGLLAMGTSCVVTITYVPTLTGLNTGSFTASFAEVSAKVTTLTGTGVTSVTLAPIGLAFSSQGIGMSTGIQSVTVTNISPVSLNLASIAMVGDGQEDFFVDRTACPTTLSANTSCVATVGFSPTTATARTLNLVASHNGTGGTTSAAVTAVTAPPLINDPYFESVGLLAHMDGAHNGLAFPESTGRVLTRVGTPTTSTTPSKFGGASLASTTGHLTTPTNVGLQMAAVDYTVEAWVFQTNQTGGYGGTQQQVVGHNQFGVATNIGSHNLYLTNGVPTATYTTVSGSWSTTITASAAINPNTWNHLAVTRAGTVLTLWVNGVSAATGTVSGSMFAVSRVLSIGADSAGAGRFAGFIDEVRITKNVARYSVPFAPSSLAFSDTQLSTVDPTVLYMPMEGPNGSTTFTDTKNHLISRTGTPVVSSAQGKFGNSALFNGAMNNYLTSPTSSDFRSTGDMTVEGWINPTTATGTVVQHLLASGTGTTNDISLQLFGNRARFLSPPFTGITSTTTIVPGTWNHIAATRKDKTCFLFVNGVPNGSMACGDGVDTGVSGPPALGTNIRPMYIGGRPGLTGVNGYLDDIQYTRGIARYTGAFTPPTRTLTPYTALAPSSSVLTFAPVQGFSSSTSTVTITNNGLTPLVNPQVSIDGFSRVSVASMFTQTSNCTGTLAVGSSCTATVTFTPSLGGTQRASLFVSYNSDPGLAITLEGTSNLETKTFFYTGAIDSSWSAPVSGQYLIDAYGGQGGYQGSYTVRNQGGAVIRCSLPLMAGTQLKVLVGQLGTATASAGNGAGGTFVATSSNTPLVVAGGGGGGFIYGQGGVGLATNNGTTLGGTREEGGGWGGAGFTGDGGELGNVKSFVNGGTSVGSFGGGATGAGGGGGYNGGSSFEGSGSPYGTGGGSYCGGAQLLGLSGYNNSNQAAAGVPARVTVTWAP